MTNHFNGQVSCNWNDDFPSQFFKLSNCFRGNRFGDIGNTAISMLQE